MGRITPSGGMRLAETRPHADRVLHVAMRVKRRFQMFSNRRAAQNFMKARSLARYVYDSVGGSDEFASIAHYFTIHTTAR